MTDFLNRIMPNVLANWTGENGMVQGIWQTLYMTFWTTLIGGFIGLVLGIALVIYDEQGILSNRWVYSILDKVVNIFRSIPFIILLSVVFPITQLLVGTTIGPKGALVPLIIGTAPFYARQVQNTLVQIDPGVIESAEALGYGPWTIITQVYLREGLPDLIRASVLTIISIIGLTAMAGAVGGGGLGYIAVSKGYQRYQNDITIVATLLILVIVFVIQGLGDLWARKIDHR
ncbi:metal ion ABC transporter permease [Lapidilactobacillus concavus DSM 17758]|uniref:Metal ion ABC transporter permease n=1 Tax=Lapidilactobacillus concavus DSM 17758 TaxID=1423735 RepID=A0A0R1W4L9_9LACO|nr:metal ion ABC transporter permease [Lapidilactobacillus concavus DSM 17758]GEL13301.1 ABC transporter permease [Lapidilactobacillus concavus]